MQLGRWPPNQDVWEQRILKLLIVHNGLDAPECLLAGRRVDNRRCGDRSGGWSPPRSGGRESRMHESHGGVYWHASITLGVRPFW